MGVFSVGIDSGASCASILSQKKELSHDRRHLRQKESPTKRVPTGAAPSQLQGSGLVACCRVRWIRDVLDRPVRRPEGVTLGTIVLTRIGLRQSLPPMRATFHPDIPTSITENL
jgi:hypothetical protein